MAPALYRPDLAAGLMNPPRTRVRLTLASVAGWERPLLVRIHAGDSTALGELYEALGGLVYDSALRVTHEPLAAELLTIGVFTRLLRCPHEFPADQLLRSLTRLVHRRATRWIRE